MAKRFKLKFTIPSFQFCRPKSLSNFPGNPEVPAIYRLSPVNPKALDIGYPNFPGPPPPTPDVHRVPCNYCIVSSKMVSVGHVCRQSRATKQHDPFDYNTDSLDDVFRESTFGKVRGDKVKNEKARGRRSATSDSSSISNKLNNRNNSDAEESETLIFSSTSVSDEFCHQEIVRSPEKATQKPDTEVSRHRKNISSMKKVQRLREQASQNPSTSETEERTKKTGIPSGSTTSCCTVEGRVTEGFAVVKKSMDPYEDFKKSMHEMIIEMEMFEANELEQLLQCFLAVNSPHYHGVIVRAFMDIWQELFCETASDDRNSPAGL